MRDTAWQTASRTGNSSSTCRRTPPVRHRWTPARRSRSSWGSLAYRRNRFRRRSPIAHDHHRQALRIHHQTGSRIGETIVLNNLGLVYQRQGRYDQARHHHRDALQLCRTFGFPGDEAESLNALAEAARSMGDLAAAIADHDAAPALAREISYRPEQARAHDGLAHVHRDLGHLDLAHEHAQQALDLYAALDVPEADEIRTFLGDLHQ